ncbi:IclR helix-turn-helix domain-containing protein [Methylobacterium sp. 174MFSha1.1]|uniref:AAA family ATPase n=1 Tax=Methylobacterium sp. 174MFSha1.1 TaxID=1502749 RepID=UPI0008F0AFE5|nr:AAA family ATPase [Methylobacterium sp. 174MFSha1.1]SFU78066.1 IclR helix-turn-helix domain-containing protein [Methylobacterium sp. 174MFSha1.1]
MLDFAQASPTETAEVIETTVDAEAGTVQVRPKLGRLNATALLAKRLPTIEHIVPGYIQPGLSIVAGKPKTGKSWLSLGLAVAVATGGPALGNVPVKQGSVLYLALEDNERRLQQRLRQILQEQEVALDGLYFETECPRLDAGGAEAIREWVDATEDARMVIVDVFTKIRPERSSSETGYESDYRALMPLKQLADETSIAVVVVHHTRKMAAEDPFETVSGTNGITGAADTILILDRGGQGTTLYARGRDIEEIETALLFDKQSGAWSAQGPAAEVRRSDERQAILAALAEGASPMSPTELSIKLDVPNANVRQLLQRMLSSGEVSKRGRGLYVLNEEGDGEVVIEE